MARGQGCSRRGRGPRGRACCCRGCRGRVRVGARGAPGRGRRVPKGELFPSLCNLVRCSTPVLLATVIRNHQRDRKKGKPKEGAKAEGWHVGVPHVCPLQASPRACRAWRSASAAWQAPRSPEGVPFSRGRGRGGGLSPAAPRGCTRTRGAAVGRRGTPPPRGPGRWGRVGGGLWHRRSTQHSRQDLAWDSLAAALARSHWRDECGAVFCSRLHV